MVVSGMVIKVSRVEIWDEGRGTRPTAGGRRADGGLVFRGSVEGEEKSTWKLS